MNFEIDIEWVVTNVLPLDKVLLQFMIFIGLLCDYIYAPALLWYLYKLINGSKKEALERKLWKQQLKERTWKNKFYNLKEDVSHLMARQNALQEENRTLHFNNAVYLGHSFDILTGNSLSQTRFMTGKHYPQVDLERDPSPLSVRRTNDFPMRRLRGAAIEPSQFHDHYARKERLWLLHDPRFKEPIELFPIEDEIKNVPPRRTKVNTKPAGRMQMTTGVFKDELPPFEAKRNLRIERVNKTLRYVPSKKVD